jgi:hypothetical protein
LVQGINGFGVDGDVGGFGVSLLLEQGEFCGEANSFGDPGQAD